MPLSEGQWQSQLVKCCRETYGGYSIRLSSLQRYGTPDLLIQLPGLPAAYIETKVAHYAGIEKTGGSITVATTLLQRETLRQIQQAGGLAAIWVLLNDKIVLVVTNPQQEYAKLGDVNVEPPLCKERGRPWPIASLIHRMKE